MSERLQFPGAIKNIVSHILKQASYLFVVGSIGFLLQNCNGKSDLPKYGPRSAGSNGDTIYHLIPPFTFWDQNGQKVSGADFESKIYVADFFFTTCPGICPVMTKQMYRVQQAFRNNDDIRIISHTVDPETDSLSILKHYALLHSVNDNKWKLVTGNKREIYKLAREGYFVTAMEGDGGENDFIHTEKFVLIDKQGTIRGYYDGTDSSEVDLLIEHINILDKEKK